MCVTHNLHNYNRVKNYKKIFTGPTHRLLLSFTVISEVYRSFIPHKTAFTKYCLTQWISKFPGSFEIHWVRQYQVNFMDRSGGHSKYKYLKDWVNFHRSHAWQIVLIFNTEFAHPHLSTCNILFVWHQSLLIKSNHPDKYHEKHTNSEWKHHQFKYWVW